MLNEKTKENLRRKSHYVDRVQLRNGVPLFSWIDINPTELCNRKCIFCPRVNEHEYPNQQLHLSLELADKIASELKHLDYQGVVVFSGFGEPTMAPNLIEIINIFSKVCRTELVTNGDFLKPSKIKKLKDAGLDYFVVSLYDGAHQIDEFDARFSEVGVNKDDYILRDRWHTEEDSFGLKLTNRAGTIQVGEQVPINIKAPCYYTAYSMTIDWNGDILLCMQDWNKKVKLGNVGTESLFDIWTSKNYQHYRQKLLNSDRNCYPCSGCNTDGTLHGYEHKDVWLAKG